MIKKGDLYLWTNGDGSGTPVNVLVRRVARDGSWADIRCWIGGSSWGKRQRLPFGAGFREVGS